MRRLTLLSCAALFGIATLTQAASAASWGRSGQRAVFTTLAPRGVTAAVLRSQVPGQSTIPYFTSSVTSPLDHNQYTYSIAGTNPMTQLSSTTITYVPIIMRIKFPNGVVLDPTKPGCGDSVSVANRFFGSPLFNSTTEISNGINVGTTQLTDAFQRAEFWSYTAGSNYHVLLTTTTSHTVTVSAPYGSTVQAGACAGSAHDLGMIDINSYDSIITGLANKYATPTQIPVTLSYNTVETESGQCCVIGYHSDYNRSGGIQTYATGAYTDPGEFSGLSDIGAYTHELGELFNDPFVNNATPAWGHTGQVSGCQSNLEVGDPLTGTQYSLPYNGFTYHPQELAFFDWFYRTPSHGTAGKYSYEGTFTSAQGACS